MEEQLRWVVSVDLLDGMAALDCRNVSWLACHDAAHQRLRLGTN